MHALSEKSSAQKYEAIREQLENLRMAGEDQLGCIALKQQTMANFQEHINIPQLIKLYNNEKSHLADIIDWYGEQQFWMKILIGIFFTAMASVFHISIFIAALCYAGISFLFENHYQASKKQEQLIFNDLEDLNTSIETSICFLNIMKENLEQTMLILSNLGIQVSEEFVGLTSQCDALNAKITEFNILVNSLTKAKEEQTKAMRNLEMQLDNATMLLRESQESLDEKSCYIEDLLGSMDKTTKSLDNRSNELAEIIAGYQVKTQELVRLIDTQNTKLINIDEDSYDSSWSKKKQQETSELLALAQKSILQSEHTIAMSRRAMKKHQVSDHKTNGKPNRDSELRSNYLPTSVF